MKISFFVESEDEEGGEVESMWAERSGQYYRLDNIPFFARNVACNDLVSAKLDANGVLWFVRVVEPSSHSTIRIFATNFDDVERIRRELELLGCACELYNRMLIAVDVPWNVSYELIREYLESFKARGEMEYQEACFGHS